MEPITEQHQLERDLYLGNLDENKKVKGTGKTLAELKQAIVDAQQKQDAMIANRKKKYDEANQPPKLKKDELPVTVVTGGVIVTIQPTPLPQPAEANQTPSTKPADDKAITDKSETDTKT